MNNELLAHILEEIANSDSEDHSLEGDIEICGEGEGGCDAWQTFDVRGICKKAAERIEALEVKDNQWISVESLNKEKFDGTSEVLAWNGSDYLLGYVYYDLYNNMFGCEDEGGFLFGVTHFQEPKPPTE